MAEALRQIASLDLEPAHLQVAAQNHKAVALYQRWGFVQKDAIPHDLTRAIVDRRLRERLCLRGLH